MRILTIGQLPKEIGGNYTTGAANVLYELSKNIAGEYRYYTFGTNIPRDNAVKASAYPYQYIGYRICLLGLMKHFLISPLCTFKKIYHYIHVDNENPLRMLFYEENIRGVIKTINPDIIHVHSIGNISVAYFAKDGLNTPIILTCHGIFYRGDPNDKVNKIRYYGNLKFASVYTGLTNESLSEYKKFLGIDSSSVKIIPNGVDCKKFYFSETERANIRNYYNVDNDCFVFITVASVQHRKGQLDFVKILNNITFKYQYWIVGNGPDMEPLKKYIEENNMQNKVLLLGYKSADELYKYYSAADIYAHVSKQEGQALSELEANATGLRTIVNKLIVGTIANDVYSSNYYIIDMEKMDVAAMERWVLSEKDYKRKSNLTFDWRFIADKYCNLYKTLLNK